MIVLGCSNNTNLDNKENESYEEIWQENAALSRSLDYDVQLILKKEEFCQKFTLAKGNVLSAISVGYQNYMSKGGCGEKCYKKDLDSALLKVYSNLHYFSQSKVLLEATINMGDKRELRVTECDKYMKPEWKNFDIYAQEARGMLVAAASGAGKR